MLLKLTLKVIQHFLGQNAAERVSDVHKVIKLALGLTESLIDDIFKVAILVFGGGSAFFIVFDNLPPVNSPNQLGVPFLVASITSAPGEGGGSETSCV